MSDKTFQDKAVIVTGASSGIGRALTLRLADQGAWIVLAARDAQRLDALAEECRQRGGKSPLPYNTNYIASKYAVHGFSDSLRMELAKAGVSITLICPYWVVTEFHERLMDKDGTPRGPKGRAIYSDKTMTADECAAIALKAAARRKREVLMGPGWPAIWLRMIAPGLVDKITIEMVLKPAARRVTKAQCKE